MPETPADLPQPTALTRLPYIVRWIVLAGTSALICAIFMALHVPAALLLGSMIAAVTLALKGIRLSLPERSHIFAQVVIGCLIAESLSANAMAAFIQQAPLLLGIILATIGVTSLVGYILARMEILPGTTALWGSSAGAASAMTLMSEEFGADPRLVAFMQYVRAMAVAGLASIITTLVVHATGNVPSDIDPDQVSSFLHISVAMLIATAAASIAVFLRIPAGALLGPLLVMGSLKLAGFLNVTMPIWLLIPAYLIIGWRIGLGFTRQVLRHVSRALPAIMLSTALLLLFCALLALALVFLLDVDPLSAYLATSPGGADSIAIIAATSNVDVPLVMSMQMTRLILVVILSPFLARILAKRLTSAK
ncbi:AbrB family transcriptional regulator [Altericroceibacterium spongiae]|uniref:AbrB family transcriptional regulator n=1 Tax=Altericroceibacterium spongiae TaxID=2320269 RepID=A0A420EEW1_9SPHN|nr:AbrB family transcriptional regulator [Altericroceibacterium spongiae]RKF19213.1 AbrB family transcriptional regulator [Altericroceibacterium spongiae]